MEKDRSNVISDQKDMHNTEIDSYQKRLNIAETQILELNFFNKNLRRENSKWSERYHFHINKKRMCEREKENVSLKKEILDQKENRSQDTQQIENLSKNILGLRLERNTIKNSIKEVMTPFKTR